MGSVPSGYPSSSLPAKTAEAVSPTLEAEKKLSTQKREDLSRKVSPEHAHARAVLEKWDSQGLFTCPLKQQGDIIKQIIELEEMSGMNFDELSQEESQYIIERLNVCDVEEVEKKEVEAEKQSEKTNKTSAVEAVKKLQANGATTIAEYETALKELFQTGKISEKVYTEYALEVAKIKNQLNAVSQQFTPEQQQKIFGGNLADKVQINFGGSCTAEVFADVFVKIDNADISEAEKTELKDNVASTLGIPRKNQRAKGAGQLKSQLYLQQQQAGAKRNPERKTLARIEKENAVILRDSPLIIAYSNPTGETDYICEGQVDNANEPIVLPFNKDMSNETLNALMNQHFFRAVASNHNAHGVLASLMGTGTLLSGAVKAQTETSALGTDDLMQSILHMNFGTNILYKSRFLSPEELDTMADNMRFLVPKGDFGGFNSINPADQTKLLQALGFGNNENGRDAIRNAGDKMRSIGASGGERSYELLYDAINPKAKENGYQELREKIGKDLFDQLKF